MWSPARAVLFRSPSNRGPYSCGRVVRRKRRYLGAESGDVALAHGATPYSEAGMIRTAYEAIKEPLNFAASALSILIVILTAVTWLTQSLPLAVLALAASLLLNAALVIALIRLRAELTSRRALAEHASRHAQALRAGSRAGNAWLPDLDDLGTIAMTNADLEKAYDAAQKVADEHIGPQSVIRFDDIRLMEASGGIRLPNMPWITFHAHSAATGMSGAVGSRPGETGAYAIQKGDHYRGSAKPPPWRQDDQWADLVRLSWRAVKPFSGNARLRWSDGLSRWEIAYSRDADPRLEPDVVWTLTEGALAQVR